MSARRTIIGTVPNSQWLFILTYILYGTLTRGTVSIGKDIRLLKVGTWININPITSLIFILPFNYTSRQRRSSSYTLV